MVDPGRSAQVVFPNAKINVGLQVRGRRPDGFHDLDSLFLPIPWCDTLEIVTPGSRPQFTLHLHGQPVAGDSADNLIARAHRLLAQDHNLPPVDMHLIKAIPSGAGLGGGSADGAFALRLINDHFSLGRTTTELEALAAQLGSDCPFFIRNAPARVTGRGEHLSPIHLDLSGWHVAVIHPGIHVSTADAFGWIAPRDDRPGLDRWEGSGPADWSGNLINDFTAPVCQRHPEVQHAMNTLREAGAACCDMSGSGSAVFGFFQSAPDLPLLPDGWKAWSGDFPD